MNSHNRASVSFYILELLIFFQAVSGLFGGGALVMDPTGSLLKMPLDLLVPSPFSDYFIPGLILFWVLGVFPSVVFYGLLRRKKWAWLGAVVVGTALIIWIGVEIAMIGYHVEPPLQLIYGVEGILLLAITQLPSVQSEIKSSNSTP